MIVKKQGRGACGCASNTVYMKLTEYKHIRESAQ